MVTMKAEEAKETYLKLLKKMPGCSIANLIDKAAEKHLNKEESVTPYNHVASLVKSGAVKTIKKGVRKLLYLPEHYPPKNEDEKKGAVNKTADKKAAKKVMKKKTSKKKSG